MAKKPKYNAYTAVQMTDGLRTWVEHRFDMTKAFTADDHRMRKADLRDWPAARIQDMRARLAKMPADPAMKVHAHEILRILDSMPEVERGRGASREQLSELHRAEMLEGNILVIRDVLPKAAKGEKFLPGRDAGAVSPLRKAIRGHLRKNPSATAAEVWSALKARPPTGHDFMDNRLGKYIEHGTASTGYRRFQNLVSEERRPKK